MLHSVQGELRSFFLFQALHFPIRTQDFLGFGGRSQAQNCENVVAGSRDLITLYRGNYGLFFFFQVLNSPSCTQHSSGFAGRYQVQNSENVSGVFPECFTLYRGNYGLFFFFRFFFLICTQHFARVAEVARGLKTVKMSSKGFENSPLCTGGTTVFFSFLGFAFSGFCSFQGLTFFSKRLSFLVSCF